MKCENQDIVGGKCVKNDEGCLTYNDSAKLKAWKSHYERLLNVEFVWNSDSLPDLNPRIGPHLYITEQMISKAIAKMKTGNAAGPSRIVMEMIRSTGKEISNQLQTLHAALLRKAIFLQIGTFCILSGYTRVILCLETIAEVWNGWTK